jgi:hypothetical protein
VGFDGGRRGFGEVAVDGAIAVIHGTDEAAGTALLFATTAAALAFEAAAVVAGLVTIAIAEALTIAKAAVTAGDVAGVLGGALTVAVAELLLPAFGRWRAILLLTAAGLEAVRALRLEALRLRAGGLDGADGLVAARLSARERALLGIRSLVLAFTASASAALGLPHAMGHVLTIELRVPTLLVG